MKTSLIHFSIALIVFITTFSVYGFWYSAIAKKSTTVAMMESQIKTKTETASRIAAARVALADILGSETKMQNYFVSESEIVAFINDLEARGRAQGTRVAVLSVSTASEDGHPTLTLTLKVIGTFEAVMRTLGSIEYAPYYLRVGTLSLGLETKDEWHADLSIVVGSTAPLAIAVP